jgi:adenine/guanine phosphoribosyltransferase-like PRPP-binding protein
VQQGKTGLPLEPHQYWQEMVLAGAGEATLAAGYSESYPARLKDGRHLLLPIRVLPGDGTRAVASLIINQASFAVEEALAEALAGELRPFAPEIIMGVPTLGLSPAANVARQLGHKRMVPLGTSRKFWYREELSEPISSITSPGQTKSVFIDPRMLPLLESNRVALVDDVISSGASIAAVLRLLDKANIKPVAIGAAMLQSTRWREPLAPWLDRIVAPLYSPMFEKTGEGRWLPLT